MSGNKLYCNLKCVARVATLQQAPSSLRLSVRQPRQGCLPWWSKKHKVATVCFKEALWQQGVSGEYEQTVECEVKDLARLSLLEADLPVKVKCWTKGRPSKMLLQDSLGSLLDLLEGSPASEAWLAFTATGQGQQVWCQRQEEQGGAWVPVPHSYDALMNSQDSPMEHDDLWEEIPLQEEESLEVQLPEGPHWWEQDTGLLPPEWNLPAFPGIHAAPRCRGEADAGQPEVALSAPSQSGEADEWLPEVALPAPRLDGRAARSSMAGWRRGFFIVVAYVIYATWTVIWGDDFLYAISDWLDGSSAKPSHEL